MKRNLYIVQYTELGKEPDILERTGNPPLRDLIRLETDDALAIELNGSRGRLIHAGDEIERRGLARAIRPDKTDKLALVNEKIKIRYSLEAAKYFGNVFCLE